VWSEPPEAELANLRFLAGYRRGWLFDEDLLAEIRAADLSGATLGEAFHAFPRHPDWRVRAAMLRLLWCQHGHEGCRSAGQQRSATLNSGLPADTADRIHLGRGLPDAGDFGPPRRRRHNTGFQEFQAVEEAGEPLGAAQMV
jgi:hypothetical protein